MKLNKQFSSLTFVEYLSVIDNHKKYTDFNTLGLFRSIIENEKLSDPERILLRDYSASAFRKTFDFLQIKDPITFFKVSTFDRQLTKGDEQQLWKEIISNQQKILRDKRIKDRNFGTYAKHECGYPDCNFNGLMVKKGSFFSESEMCFPSDKPSYVKKVKSEKIKSDRKKESNIIESEIKLNSASR